MTRSTSEAVMGVYRERETAPYIDVCQDPQDAMHGSIKELQHHSHRALPLGSSWRSTQIRPKGGPLGHI